MEQLKNMKRSIEACVCAQMGKLNEVDAKELGEAIDMLKDLSEAIYYCTITEAMDKSKEPTYYRDMDKESGRMYYPISSGDSRMMYREHLPMRDYREGISPERRKMYMEAKEKHMDKGTAMKELESYVQDLTHDLVEMVKDASADEKQYLEKRIAALATKIGQANN